ncbi:hypothetical protein BH11BAC2_BH11BAC2_23010 [soil metagenome]
MYKFGVTILLLISISPPVKAQLFHKNAVVDSVRTKFYWVNANAAASYIGQHNWSEETNSAISLLAAVNFRHRLKRSSGNAHEHSFRSEISYLNYADSTWIKGSDYLRVNLNWMSIPGKKITQTYSVYFSTQWLNSWTMIPLADQTRKSWSGGFMNPANMELSYGTTIELLKNSRLILSPATVKIQSRPRYPLNPDPDKEKDKTLFITKHSYIRTEYGFSAQVNLFEQFCDDILLLENDSRFFFNALNKQGIHLDLSNRIAIRFLKFLQLRLDTKILYDPDYSMHFQYRQEVLLGVFYEHRK